MADKTFAEHVTGLKQALRTSIQQHVDDFERETGMTPSSITVEFIDATALSGLMSAVPTKYLVTNVRLGFDSY